MSKQKTDPSLENLAAELERLGGGESPRIIDSEKWLEDYADSTIERAKAAFRQVETEESNRIEAEDAAKVKMLEKLKEADNKEIEELDETIPGIPAGEQPERTLRWRRWWARIQMGIGWVSLICLGAFAVEPFISLDWSNEIRWAAALFVALGFIPASYAIERVFDLVQSRRLLAVLFFIASLSGLAAVVDWELLRGTILIHDLQEEDADEGGDIVLNLPESVQDGQKDIPVKVDVADESNDNFYDETYWPFTLGLIFLTVTLLLVAGGASHKANELTNLIGVASKRSSLIERRKALRMRVIQIEGRLAGLGKNRSAAFKAYWRRDIELMFWPRILERRNGKRKGGKKNAT